MDTHKYNKRGFLEDQYLYFHLTNQDASEIYHHYHDFKKIVIFLSGQVTYIIDGVFYFLKPGDILLINQQNIHRPIIDTAKPYERIIIWMSDSFLTSNSHPDEPLSLCFEKAESEKRPLLELTIAQLNFCTDLLHNLEEVKNSHGYGVKLMTKNLLLQFMIHLNRISLNYEPHYQEKKEMSKIEEINAYINTHLNEDLTVDYLSRKFFISKYYLMHRFKAETGFTLHNYIIQKRLISAASSIRKGHSVKDAYMNNGFREYSTFLRSFKKMFHVTPGNYK